MTIKQHEVVLSNSLPVFVAECIEMSKLGYEIDPDMIPTQIGYAYEAGFIREATTEQLWADAEKAAKPTPQERMAHARAVRAEKAAAKVAEGSANG